MLQRDIFLAFSVRQKASQDLFSFVCLNFVMERTRKNNLISQITNSFYADRLLFQERNLRPLP